MATLIKKTVSVEVTHASRTIDLARLRRALTVIARHASKTSLVVIDDATNYRTTVSASWSEWA